MTIDIDNMQDIIDSRDIIARIEELEAMAQLVEESRAELKEHDAIPEDGRDEDWEDDRGALVDALDDAYSDFGREEDDELASLRSLADEASGSPDWQYGETLIRDTYFKEYARQLAEDCGMLEDTSTWPGRCIDWDQAARELQMDYMQVDYDGVEYWIHA